MYRDDLEAMQARLRTLEAELEAERRARRAAAAVAQAARAKADEASLQARRLAAPPSQSLLRRHWLALALLIMMVPAWWASSAVLRASGGARVARLYQDLQSSQRQADLLKQELETARLAARARRCPPCQRGEATSGSTLSRAELQQGMRRVKPAVQACYKRYKVPGMANVQIRIDRDGSVSHVKVVGMFTGTPTGECVARTARAARFPPFTGPPITITYPFILR